MALALYLILLAVNACAVVVLAAFTVRRLIYGAAALFDPASIPPPTPDQWPDLLVLIPCRNEATVIGRLLDALSVQDYPKDHIRAILIDDASTDDTGRIAEERAKSVDFLQVLRRAEGGKGKSDALNEALASEPWGELVAVFDADSVPAPDFLSRLAAHFGSAAISAATGMLKTLNPDDSAVSYFVYVEGLVHQRVTMRQAARLGMTPAILGTGYIIRRSDLRAEGGYKDIRLEDSELSVRLRAAGKRVVVDLSAKCGIEAPATVADYVRQHTGWARGFNRVLAGNWQRLVSDPNLGFWTRIDALMFSSGYLDRAFLAAGLGITLINQFDRRFFFPWWLWAAILAAPIFQVLLCLIRERAPARHFARLPLVLLLFPLDIASALVALFSDATARPTKWAKTPRRNDSGRG